MNVPLVCACCSAPMQTFRCAHKLSGELALDVCFGCRSIWFDQFESLQMAPSGVLELFRLIHAHDRDVRNVWGAELKCPRCEDRLVQSFDLCKNGRFSYYRCVHQHGRFTGFSALMIEKGFVRQLNGDEIEALAQRVQVVRCSSCGAPVDIRTQSACSYCHAPLAILDPDAVDQALSRLNQAATPPDRLPAEAAADLLLDHERLKWQATLEQAKDGRWDVLTKDHLDLATDGLGALWSLIRR